MGNSESSPDGNNSPIYDGYRVLGVQPGSPAAEAGLVSFLDFVVGCHGELFAEHSLEETREGNDGRQSDEEEVTFSDNPVDDDEKHAGGSDESAAISCNAISCNEFVAAIGASMDKPLSLIVHNIKSGTTRETVVVPRKGGKIEDGGWGGDGSLGVTIRPDDYRGAMERILRVLEVQEDSPASAAGLTMGTDYLLGTQSTAFPDDDALADLLQRSEDRPVTIYVYSSLSDMVRLVTILPTRSWGSGRGLLGAEVGWGYLHSIPGGCRETDGTSVPDARGVTERFVGTPEKMQGGAVVRHASAPAEACISPSEVDEVSGTGTSALLSGGDAVIGVNTESAPPPPPVPVA